MTPVRPMAVGWSKVSHKDRHTTHRRGFSSFMAVGWSKRVLSLFANGLPLDMKDSSREHSQTQGQRCARQCSHRVLKTCQTSKRAYTDEQTRAPRIKRLTRVLLRHTHSSFFKSSGVIRRQGQRVPRERRGSGGGGKAAHTRRRRLGRQGGSYAEKRLTCAEKSTEALRRGPRRLNVCWEETHALRREIVKHTRAHTRTHSKQTHAKKRSERGTH